MKKMILKVVGIIVIVVSICVIAFACATKHDDHQWTESVKTVGTSAKCTEKIRTCSVCDAKEVISTTQHDYSYTPAQPLITDGVCTGYTQAYTCKVCGYEYTRQLTETEITDANLTPIEDVHVWTSEEQEITADEYKAWLEQEGKDEEPIAEGHIAKYYKVTKVCSHCDQVETSMICRTEPDPNYHPDTDVSTPVDTEPGGTEPPDTEVSTPVDTSPPETSGNPECEHQYTTTTVAPTCTTTGYTQFKCSKCDKSYVSDKTDALGHSYGSWETVKNATCDTDGTRSRKCTSCGDAQQESISATGHSYGAWAVTKDAGCDTNGVKTRTCSKCSNPQQDIVPPKGHTWDEGQVTTAPTSCGDKGVCRYTCTTCGARKTTQINGTHTFGGWEYEEYQWTEHLKPGDPGYYPGHSTLTYTSHRKMRKCTKCGYTERDGTPDHDCTYGCSNHKVTTIKEGTCTTPTVMRSTCTICGWYEDYNGAKGKHQCTTERRHLTDYTEYTNELDAEIDTCTACGKQSVIYTLGKGYGSDNKYYTDFATDPGDAYMGAPVNDDFSAVSHPEWQTVLRSFFYDQNGYVTQFTYYWWYNGQRYSQVIKCGPGEIEAWFAEYGLTAEEVGLTPDRVRYHIRIFGTYAAPYRISWTS